MRIAIVLFSLFFAVACQESEAQKGGLIGIAETQTLMQTESDLQIIDVRTPQEWAEGVVEGAKLLNFYDETFSQEVLETLDPNKPVLVYCRSGGRSGKTAQLLKENGFTQVYDLKGGIGAWNKASGELVAPR